MCDLDILSQGCRKLVTAGDTCMQGLKMLMLMWPAEECNYEAICELFVLK